MRSGSLGQRERRTGGERVPHHSVIAVGAGPSNLSFAALSEDLLGGVAVLERGAGPAWHPGLLGPGVQLQTAWIKDLVSLADPRNRLSFLNYLVSTGRVYAFLNAQFDAVPRLEYARYLAWATEELGTVRFGVDVSEIDFTDRFVVSTSAGAVATSEHLVLGLGTRAHVPPCFRDRHLDGVLLAEQMDTHLNATQVAPYEQVLVVGGGQTGAECVLSLIGRGFRDIRWVGRRHWFAPLDDSPSANDFFRPTYLRFFQGLPSGTRERYVTAQTLASDGISMDTLRRLYQLNYESYLREGRSPVMMLPGRDVVDAASRHGSVALWCERDWGGRERHTARYVVLATGREPAALPFSPGVRELIDADATGEPVVEQDYSLRWKHGAEHRLFVQNRGRLSHGVADPNLSLLAVRSAIIINSLLDRDVFPIRDAQVCTIWS